MIGYDDTSEFSRTGLSWVLKTINITELCRKTGIPERTLRNIRAGATPTGKTRKLSIPALITPTVPPLDATSGLEASGERWGLLDDIRTIGPSRLSKQAGIGRRAIYNILNGATPKPATFAKLQRAVRTIKGRHAA